MAGEGLKVTVDGAVARLTFARPERHNAFDDALIDAITAALEKAAADPVVRVVQLAGEGKSFSAGADLGWMRRMAGYGEAENLADARALARMLRTLNELPKPTVARVHGPCYGGGVGLVAACDIAVATPSAQFVLSEARLGLTPSTISPYVVQAIGARAARRYFLTAEPIRAAEALHLGLIHVLVYRERLDHTVDDITASLLRNGPNAIAECKWLVGRVAAGPVDDAMIDETARHIARVRSSAEGREGIAAFLEKRAPKWRG